METVTLRPLAHEVLYEGSFSELRFGLFATPIPIYKSLLEHLGAEGAELSSLRIDTASLATANVACILGKTNTTVRIRIDRFEVACPSVLQSNLATVMGIIGKSWAALQEVDSDIALTQHRVLVASYSAIAGFSYDQMMLRYASADLDSSLSIGMAFYFPEGMDSGSTPGHILFDRVPGRDDMALVKVNVGFSATAVSLNTLPERLEEYVTKNLARLGIGVSR